MAIRTHVDITDSSLLARGNMDVKRQMAPHRFRWLPSQDGLLRADSMDNLVRALDLGVDVVGGFHFDDNGGWGAISRDACEVAARGLW